MKLHLLLFVSALGCAGCANGIKLVRTPPGTSVELALAKKAELVRLPGPPPGMIAATPRTRVPAVEPELPGASRTSVTEAFSRGQFCMEVGAEAEAISAFQEAVKMDPKFGDAWQLLAALYEKQGNKEKASDAARRAKKAGASVVDTKPQTLFDQALAPDTSGPQ